MAVLIIQCSLNNRISYVDSFRYVVLCAEKKYLGRRVLSHFLVCFKSLSAVTQLKNKVITVTVG